jgi:hypothetical protein
MTDSTFEECFTLLETYHDKPQPAAAKERYREELAGVPDELFVEAVNAATRKYAPGKFPSINELQGFVEDAHESLARRRPKTAPEAPPDPEEGKAVLQKIRAELDQRDREKEQRAAEKRERDRQDRTQRINARKQLFDKQALELKEQRQSKVSKLARLSR